MLLGQQANFLAFGSKARIDYANQEENGMLFENFKMRLNDGHGGLEPVAEASNGNRVPVLKLITHSLKHIKDEAMAAINKSQVDCSLVRALFLCLCVCPPLSLVLSSLYVSHSVCLSSLSSPLLCVCACLQKKVVILTCAAWVVQVMKLSPSEIKWVVSVPAIWRDAAKVISSCIYLGSCNHQPADDRCIRSHD